ncbi:hypothetical protein B2J93_5517 [Marssonina coronariae]|uniref:Ubiquitin-like domain-containing protein n=1 Tax=Diplocarpon coronariae TaxID=2795749 RepID=A0A218YZK3_9HELO|nr:hypothetical protein JHW43_000319 [Diplocarpon mali]OWP01237.1 hypothetical protein B2J93_5517 [Marssonina coronariae]
MNADIGEGSAEEVATKPVKRSLFRKKITVKTVSEAEEPLEFFSRAKDIYHQRAAEQERRRQKKQVKIQRKRSSTSAEVTFSSPGEKRRRVSSQGTTYSSDENAAKDEDKRHDRRGSIQNQPRGSSTSLSARYSDELRKGKSPNDKEVAKGYISLSDSGSEEEAKVTTLSAIHPTDLNDEHDFAPPPKTAPLVPIEDDDAYSEDEFPELLAAAQERERQKAEQKRRMALAFQGQNHDNGLDDMFIGDGSSVQEVDPVVEILITSRIEGSTPLRVKRKMSQQLQLVRSSWCDKQIINGHPMSQELKGKVYLTWKGTRIFDFNTCSSLVDGKGKASRDGFDENGGIHFEAWTSELFDAWKAKQEAREKTGRIQAGAEEAQEEVPVKKTRLLMKSRDLEYKTIVKPDTTIGKMITVFRRANRIPDEQEIKIFFDGEELESETKVEDTELEDMDSVEVHIN